MSKKNYAVDIDLLNGEQVREFEVDSLAKAIKYFDKYSKNMLYKNTAIDNIQLLKLDNTETGYEVIDSKFNDDI